MNYVGWSDWIICSLCGESTKNMTVTFGLKYRYARKSWRRSISLGFILQSMHSGISYINPQLSVEKQIQYYVKDTAKEKRESAGRVLLPYYLCRTK